MEEGIPQGLKPAALPLPLRPKAEALGYLEARSFVSRPERPRLKPRRKNVEGYMEDLS
jgi:hypothetical protein